MIDIAEPNWPAARKIVREQLAARNAHPAWLAQQTGLNRSVISRFLAGQPLDVGSALRIFHAIQPGMDTVEKQALLQTMGLFELAMALRNSFPVATRPVTASSYEAGCRLMVDAFDQLQDPFQALFLFQQAEQAFGPGSPGAARAAVEAVQSLVSLGDFARAEGELARIATIYDGVLDMETRQRLTFVHGWLHYARRDLQQASIWFLRLLRLEEEAGFDQIGPHHFLGMIDTRLGLQCSSKAEADRLYVQADIHLRHASDSHLRLDNDDIAIAFDLLRVSQLRAAQSRHDEARQVRQRARSIFQPLTPIACLNVDVDTANEALQNGETACARKQAQAILEGFAETRYAQGLARGARLLALAAMQEGRNDEALEAAVAGVCFNPCATHGPRQRLREFATELNDAVLREVGQAQHGLVLARIRVSARERRGVFAPLGRIAADGSTTLEQLLADLSGASR